MILFESPERSIPVAVAALVACTLFLEFVLFPCIKHCFIQRIAPDLSPTVQAKAVLSTAVIVLRFGVFAPSLLIWGFLNTDLTEFFCGLPPKDSCVVAFFICFTIHCSLFLMETFSPRFHVPVSALSWIHHMGMWANWIIFVSINLEDRITMSLGLMYGCLVAMFAWSDTLQVLRYTSDNPEQQYRYFQAYYRIKCVQFPLFVAVPLLWANVSYHMYSCIATSTYVVISVMVFIIGVPDLFLLVTKMREILLHYQHKALSSHHADNDEEKQAPKNEHTEQASSLSMMGHDSPRPRDSQSQDFYNTEEEIELTYTLRGSLFGQRLFANPDQDGQCFDDDVSLEPNVTPADEEIIVPC